MKRLVRLVAVDEKLKNEKIVVHFILDGEKVIHQEFFGYMESGNDKYPMIFHFPTKPNAELQTVEFGECCENIASSNLFSKNIKVGEYFTFNEDGISYTYQIKHVTDMLVEN